MGITMIENLDSLFKQISLGVYVIGVSDGEQLNAFTAAWVMQVSFNPPLLAFSINSKHHSYQLLKASGKCSINVLGRNQLAIAEHFGKPSTTDKMAGYQWQFATTGAPILSESLVYFDCFVKHYSDAGDHKVVICSVASADRLNNGVPMLYQQTGDIDGSSGLYE